MRHHLVALAWVAGAAFVTYANALGGGFVYDARALVLENPVIRRATAENVRFILTHDYWQPMATNGLYRPLTVLSWLVDWAVLGHGDRPFGYHLENVVLHVGCAALVYALVWQLAHRMWPAAVGAALFALHPLATEAVTNVVGRADLLAALGVLGGLLCYIRGAASSGPARAGWVAGLLVATVVALFSKESGIALALAIPLYDLAFPPPGGWRLRLEHVLVALVLAVYGTAHLLVEQRGLPPDDLSPIDNPLARAELWPARLTAVLVVVRELALVVWPATLSADYSYRQIPVVAWPPHAPGDWAAVLALVALAFLGWALARARHRRPAVFLLSAFAAVALLPASNLVKVIGAIMAERFLYLPLAGLAGAAALLADELAGSGGRRRAATAVFGVLLLACAVRTVVRNGDWGSDVRLWAATVQAAPESAKAHKAYAAALFETDPRRAQIERVIEEAERAVAIRPDYQQALADLGGYYVVQGDLLAEGEPEEAKRRYEQAAAVLERARRQDQRAAARFVEKMLARGRARDAIPEVGDGTLYNNLSLAYVRAHRLEEALGAYDQLRRLEPSNVGHYMNVAVVLVRLGRWEDAAINLFEAVNLAPGDQAPARQLVEVYRQFYKDGHALVIDGNNIQVNLDDPAVHRHRCRAWVGLAEIFTRARLRARAADARAQAEKWCDPAAGELP